MSDRRIVIIGAGVVGVGLADELLALGERDITVIDKGPLFHTGGSSSHAPGLVSRSSTSKFLSDTADYTIRKFQMLATDEGPAFPGLGTLEVAYNEARLQELWRRHDAALAFGWRGRMIDPDEALARWPIIERDGLLGAYATDDEGLAATMRAIEAMAKSAEAAGVRFIGDTEVTGFEFHDGRISGVAIGEEEVLHADVVVVCAGVWTPALAQQVGLALPVLPMEHQYAITEDLPQLAANADRFGTMPILRHHDIGIYFRDHGAAVGIGSFHHSRLPVAPEDLDTHPRNVDESLAFAFTEEDFAESWELITRFMPALEDTGFVHRFNGVFGFTADGYPVIGEHPAHAGLWFAASVWVTHSQGVARMLAETLVDGVSQMDMSPAELSRFDERELEYTFYAARADDQYRDIYVAHHPAEPATSARDIRFSPFAGRQRALGAAFFNVATWERPQWFEANAALAERLPALDRDEWSMRHWSPIVIAEHLQTRETAGLFDLSPLYRMDVRGPGAASFLARMVAGRTDLPVGRTTYSVMLDGRGGIRSDVTVTRLSEERFWLVGNGPRDADWLYRHAPDDGSLTIRPVWDALACLGLWGPMARDILQPIIDIDLANHAFPYMHTREATVGPSAVIATRISYVGELGWELTCDVRDGEDLWDTVWAEGQHHGLIAAGRGALGALRLEKGYRAWGAELTPEHGPIESGLAFTERADDRTFVGADAVGALAAASSRTLRCIQLQGQQPAMGSEPVMAGDQPVGYVTSSAWGASIGAPLAYAWIDDALEEGDPVRLRYFDRELHGTIVSEPRFDPTGQRMRS